MPFMASYGFSSFLVFFSRLSSSSLQEHVNNLDKCFDLLPLLFLLNEKAPFHSFLSPAEPTVEQTPFTLVQLRGPFPHCTTKRERGRDFLRVFTERVSPYTGLSFPLFRTHALPTLLLFPLRKKEGTAENPNGGPRARCVARVS